MAKDLPYFKFYSSEWNDGDITLEDMKTQGVFINICSYYWSQECQVSPKKLQKRFKNFTKQIKILIESEILSEEKDFIKIKFLDKQFAEREVIKHRNKANGLKGGRPKKTQSVNSGIPKENPNITNKEERREEEKRKEIKNKQKDTLPSFIDPELWNDFLEIRKKKKAINSDRAIAGLVKKLTEVESHGRGQANFEIERSIENSWKSIFPENKAALSPKTHYAGHSIATLDAIVKKMRDHQATTQDFEIFKAASKEGFKPNE